MLIAALLTSAKGREKCALTEDEEVACGTYMIESIHTLEYYPTLKGKEIGLL